MLLDCHVITDIVGNAFCIPNFRQHVLLGRKTANKSGSILRKSAAII